MLRYINRWLLVPAVLILLAVGCTDRGTNIPPQPTSAGGIVTIGHDFFRELFLQIGRNTAPKDDVKGQRVTFQIRMYIPEETIPWNHGGQIKPLPLLVILAPQDGDEHYFLNHGLKELADQMIAEGTIQPMAIACIPNDRFFGGYFYAGKSAPAGYYDFFIGGSLIDYLFDGKYSFLTDSLPVGIGGVGMGAYGAFRAALLHKGVFSSISATDGPLDFDGPSGSGGFVDLFDDALIEQGLLGGTTEDPTITSTWVCDSLGFDTLWFVCDSLGFDSLWRCDSLEDTICVESTLVIDTLCAKWLPIIGDTVCVESTLVVDTTYPPSWRTKFDSSSAWPLSKLFIGGALAFTPNDTLVDTTDVYEIRRGGTGYIIDIPDSQRFVIDDTTTLITDVVKEDQFDFDFHLPFDSTGQTYDLIWNMWLENNLEDIFADSAAVLDDVKMWFGITEEWTFGNYSQQTESWINTLRSRYDTTQVQVKKYSGYGGFPASNDQYIYDLMREILIFHSQAFEEAR